nr:retrovirus-related Pol polyprotein from transposon TNT 1-94 [Tanacetum cinerariifolium]
YSTPFPPLEKLAGAKPISRPKTIKSILKSNSTFKPETFKGVNINEPSSTPAKANKNVLASKKNSTPTDSGCSRHMTGVKSYLHKYVEQPRPKGVFGDDLICITKGYGSIKCNGVEFFLEAKTFLLALAGVEDGSFMLTPLNVSGLNVELDFKIDLIVFGLDIGLAPANFSSGGKGVL